MGYDEKLYQKIKEEYDSMRAAAENDRLRRIAEVYERIPRLKEIKDEINQAGLANIGNIIAKSKQNGMIEAVGDIVNKASSDERISFEKKIRTLEAEKQDILLKNGISPDFEKPVYHCSECEDTGYVKGKKCRCFEQRLINEMYALSNLENVLREQNFDTFDLKYFSADKVIDGQSELLRIKKIYNRCVGYCDDFDKEYKSLLFYGKTGSGKTFLSSCIAKRLIDSGKTVIYIRAAKLFTMYDDYRFGRSDEMKGMFDRIRNADFLIIDDLGSEVQNKNVYPFLLELINERIQENKKMLISTNYSVSELSDIYTNRFASRIYEYFVPLHFAFDDIRVKKFMMQ